MDRLVDRKRDIECIAFRARERKDDVVLRCDANANVFNNRCCNGGRIVLPPQKKCEKWST